MQVFLYLKQTFVTQIVKQYVFHISDSHSCKWFTMSHWEAIFNLSMLIFELREKISCHPSILFKPKKSACQCRRQLRRCWKRNGSSLQYSFGKFWIRGAWRPLGSAKSQALDLETKTAASVGKLVPKIYSYNLQNKKLELAVTEIVGWDLAGVLSLFRKDLVRKPIGLSWYLLPYYPPSFDKHNHSPSNCSSLFSLELHCWSSVSIYFVPHLSI